MPKSRGVNSAERYLSGLGEKSFLSLWSHSNVFYAAGKELADLLVICGNDIIIFQDKWSVFPEIKDISKGWERWFRRTVVSGAKQVWGAERMLKGATSKLYLDSTCKLSFPVPLPNMEEAIFHLVVVTHGGSKKCQELMGGSGSFMIRTDIKNLADHVDPFTIGDLDLNRTFVHVFDDTTLNILMRTLDTVTDFTLYLRKKEQLLRSKMVIFAAGDEELLANYLKNVNADNEHDFNFGIRDSEEVNMLALDEGGWASFIKHPQRLAQIEQDKISYLWDDLIETFNEHAVAGTQYSIPELDFSTTGLEGTEKTVRYMAREPRFMRRILSLSIKEMFETTTDTQRRVRVLSSFVEKGLYYVLLLFPLPKSSKYTHEDYRRTRAIYLQGTCMVAKMRYPDAKRIIGIATESGLHNHGRSEDALYLDASDWPPEMQAAAKKFQDEFGVLVNPKEGRYGGSEYPEVVSKEEFEKNPRNKPCPCGSGKKYKKCCQPKGRAFYRN